MLNQFADLPSLPALSQADFDQELAFKILPYAPRRCVPLWVPGRGRPGAAGPTAARAWRPGTWRRGPAAACAASGASASSSISTVRPLALLVRRTALSAVSAARLGFSRPDGASGHACANGQGRQEGAGAEEEGG